MVEFYYKYSHTFLIKRLRKVELQQFYFQAQGRNKPTVQKVIRYTAVETKIVQRKDKTQKNFTPFLTLRIPEGDKVWPTHDNLGIHRNFKAFVRLTSK